ncbi:AAA family ATPase [Flammeovirgaceae bacterium SG7u.111]|nr:AAA family ATPase [Flammeovirgaceae bacterium SG7u.132]WPO34711.1 AAA family ATPase [Flammeovirgaceae bacterium SG7u.111]
MQKSDPKDLFYRYFPHEPTPGQATLFDKLGEFIVEKKRNRLTFLLKGYAGTGKTSVISAMVKTLRHFDYKYALLAPTGRAAKVISFYAKRQAFTIHKIIYKPTEDPASGRIVFKKQPNQSKNTVFIVDEASMIDDGSDYGYRNGLLTELVSYVFEKPNSGNKLMLVGDTAQLPPVHKDISPALDVLHLEQECMLKVMPHMLTDVVRQQQASGILENATAIRLQIAKRNFQINLNTKKYKDIFRMPSQKLENGLRYTYDKYGVENTSLICRSNRSATLYNQFIRKQILYYEEELSAGDILMVVKNNYFWLDDESRAGFLANGEFAEVMRVGSVEEMGGFRFANLRLQLIDYPDETPFDAKVLLDTLHSFTPNLPMEDLNKIQEQVIEDNGPFENPKEVETLLRENPYINALQVKYAYSLTCHKSQGSQWKAVFVDLGYLNDEMKNVELMRWVYTAITRSTDELFLVNFEPDFFKD